MEKIINRLYNRIMEQLIITAIIIIINININIMVIFFVIFVDAALKEMRIVAEYFRDTDALVHAISIFQ